MNYRKILTILGAVLIFGFVAPHARTDEINQASQLTFNSPVEIPGHAVLPAGTYWFKVQENPGNMANNNVVQIFNADWTKIYGTFLTIPVAHTQTDHSQLIFAERTHGRPMALISWFYPDRVFGHEFVYSIREEARLSADKQVDVTASTTQQVYGG